MLIITIKFNITYVVIKLIIYFETDEMGLFAYDYYSRHEHNFWKCHYLGPQEVLDILNLIIYNRPIKIDTYLSERS